MRRRTRTRQNVTVTNSEAFMSAFRRLGCRSSSARARRAFYALISQLRDQVVQRLDEMYQRRLWQAYPQSPQPQSKGGKRQTRKKSTKRNRTVKRRWKKYNICKMYKHSHAQNATPSPPPPSPSSHSQRRCALHCSCCFCPCCPCCRWSVSPIASNIG